MFSAKPMNGPRKYMRKLDDYMELFIVDVLERPSIFLCELCE